MSSIIAFRNLYQYDLHSEVLQQKAFSFAVRDSLVNVGPLKDFTSGLRTNADLNATGVAKQSNYELVSVLSKGIAFFVLLDSA